MNDIETVTLLLEGVKIAYEQTQRWLSVAYFVIGVDVFCEACQLGHAIEGTPASLTSFLIRVVPPPILELVICDGGIQRGCVTGSET